MSRDIMVNCCTFLCFTIHSEWLQRRRWNVDAKLTKIMKLLPASNVFLTTTLRHQVFHTVFQMCIRRISTGKCKLIFLLHIFSFFFWASNVDKWPCKNCAAINFIVWFPDPNHESRVSNNFINKERLNHCNACLQLLIFKL